MSRRESRVSMSVRQNDALFEFESCMFSYRFHPTHAAADSSISFGAKVKKKFLLANKHITKCVILRLRSNRCLTGSNNRRLNSTLSVRIEELNAQISTLYVENLRLRASEIALSAQLKKEREKSRKIIAEAEAAVRVCILEPAKCRLILTPPPPPDCRLIQTTRVSSPYLQYHLCISTSSVPTSTKSPSPSVELSGIPKGSSPVPHTQCSWDIRRRRGFLGE